MTQFYWGKELGKFLWCFKEILKGFELVSRLSVNFHKSKLTSLNLEESFLESASYFLAYGRDKTPFKFLGIQVRSKHRFKYFLGAVRATSRKGHQLGREYFYPQVEG